MRVWFVFFRSISEQREYIQNHKSKMQTAIRARQQLYVQSNQIRACEAAFQLTALGPGIFFIFSMLCMTFCRSISLLRLMAMRCSSNAAWRRIQHRIHSNT
jgi:hypothetical protein